MRISRTCALAIAAAWAITCEPSSATGISAPTGSVFGANAKLGGYYRESVTLARRGELLVGRPEKAPIELFTLSGVEQANVTVIIRWTPVDDERYSLYVSIPESVRKEVSRGIIFLDDSDQEQILYELHGERWRQRIGQHISIDAAFPDGEIDKISLVGFNVKYAGPLWIFKNKPSVPVTQGGDMVPSQHPLMMGNPRIAFLNWLIPIVLLIVGIVPLFSKRAFRHEQGVR